jgi:hypothetical protein
MPGASLELVEASISEPESALFACVRFTELKGY